MKLNNLAVHAKHTALFAFIAMMANACTSPKERLNEMDKDIERIEAQIDSTQIKNEATDSAANNRMLQALQFVINQDAQRIDSLRLRNATLSDSIMDIDEKKVARAYPLSAFLSKADLKQLQDQLRDFHYKWNDESANNIIAGRGTLQDLYNVSFDLDYSSFEPPFHIINEAGYIRFNNPRLDHYCRQFEESIESIARQDIARKLKHRENKTEFDRNAAEIKEFERLCAINDSIYLRIYAHFAPQIKHRFDSLTEKRNTLRMQRNELAARMRQK